VPFQVTSAPSAQIASIDSVEAGGTRDFNVTVTGAGSNHRIRVGIISPSNGLGGLKFSDDSFYKDTPGGNGTFTFTLKGNFESAQVDDYSIRATYNEAILDEEPLSVSKLVFEQNADCSGFDIEPEPGSTILTEPFLFVAKNGTNKAKARIIPSGSAGSFKLEVQSGLSVSPATISSDDQVVTVDGGNTAGDFDLTARANQPN